MKRTLQKGAGNLDGILIIVFLIFVVLVTPSGKGRNSENPGFVPDTNLSSQGHGGGTGTTQTASSYRDISIGSGNAAYTYQPYEEYITIENWGDTPLDITGWQLKNGLDKRSYDRGGTLQRFSASIAVIPQAAKLLSPRGESMLQNVILGRGETAVVTTGSVGVRTPYKVVSFKENACTGYIESHEDYAFNPPLTQNCPRPSLEPGLADMDSECRTFVEQLSSCRTPEFDRLDREGEPCSNCVNGERLSSSCTKFIKEHFSYQGCVAYHSGDPDFHSGDTWRIFLGRSWEMWADKYETIELFDRFGQLVDFENY